MTVVTIPYRSIDDFGAIAPVQVRRHFSDRALVCDELRLRAARNDTEDSLTNFPLARTVAKRGDFAGELQAGNIRRCARRRGIFAFALK